MARSVFVNGTFDILHIGHLKLLNHARSLGDRLFVAIDSDRRVAELKGPDRPINSALERRTMLLNLKAVDEVEVFDSDEELRMWIKQIHPDIMIVGSDWKGKPVIGSEYAKELEFYDRYEDYSSTAKIQCIVDRGLLYRRVPIWDSGSHQP
jgi:D-beta-D-heptose 7-phosphate kinase/D-beta-D-heptose 1-phosphate adenosyltransferase